MPVDLTDEQIKGLEALGIEITKDEFIKVLERAVLVFPNSPEQAWMYAGELLGLFRLERH